MSTTAFDRISQNPAFQELFLAGTRRHVPKDSTIIEEGSAPASLYLLMSGTVAVRLSGWHGRDALLAHMHAGDFFGEMGLFPDVKARSACVQAVNECLLLEIGYDSFLTLTRKHSGLWVELASQLAARLRAANRRLAEMPLLDAQDRVWSVVSELAEHSEIQTVEGAALRITREDLGKLAGCSREVAGEALQKLSTQGRVQLRGQQIIVPMPRGKI